MKHIRKIAKVRLLSAATLSHPYFKLNSANSVICNINPPYFMENLFCGQPKLG